MMAMPKGLCVVLLSVAGVLWFPRAAHACSCEHLSPERQLAMADAVFVGRVVGSQPLAWVDLQVRETFKGTLDPQVRIPTAVSDCDYFLPPVTATTGREFLIYATVVDGKLTVSRCLGSGTVEQRRSDLERLRQRPRGEARRQAVPVGGAPDTFIRPSRPGQGTARSRRATGRSPSRRDACS
jgi:hypothetical protein